jgi:drug/metabolite transporter (DMT)-like permease
MKNSFASPERAVRPWQGRIANRWAGWALLVVPGVIWGASFLFIAEGLEALAPNGVTFTRIAIGFLTLSLFPSARKPVARRRSACSGLRFR